MKPRLSAAVDQYKIQVKDDDSRSDSYIKSASWVLDHLVQVFGAGTYPSTLTPAHIRWFMFGGHSPFCGHSDIQRQRMNVCTTWRGMEAMVHGTGKVRPNTFNLRRQILGAFLKWMSIEGYCSQGLLAKVPARKKDGTQRIDPSDAQINAALTVAAQGRFAARNYLLVLMNVCFGKRASELVRLRLKDLNLAADEPTVTFTITKSTSLGAQYETWAIQPEVLAALHAWFEEYAAHLPRAMTVDQLLACDAYHLLPRARGQGPCRRYYYEPKHGLTETRKIVKPALAEGMKLSRADSAGKAGHVLRRAAAQRAEEMGGIEVAQALLGHQSPDTTRIYLDKTKGKVEAQKILRQGGFFRPVTAVPAEGGNVVSLDERRRRPA